MAFNKLSILAVVLLAVLIIRSDIVANGSHLDVWSGPGCNNKAERYIACGCSNIKLHGGWAFSFNGPPAAMYNRRDCKGASVRRFNGNARNCNPFSWQSMFIQC
ncbi:hypothetical protein Syun_018911 [Stephania yunnanensis]|uniref:Uncharacterized protein n=1 Tax=Stephania yunnanensis TaxID=152371 RepID=A0AAP0IT97_9MAGN